MRLSRIFENLNILPISWSKQGSSKKNIAKHIDGSVNQVNGSNNIISNNVSINTGTSTQVDKDECFRLLKTPHKWMQVNNEDGCEFLSKVNNNVSVIFYYQHSTYDYADFISSCWPDNSGAWCDMNICINGKSIYSNQYCTFDGCNGSTIVRPDFEWILKPNGHENIRLFYYLENSKEAILNDFIRSYPATFSTARDYKVDQYIVTFVSAEEKDRFFAYIRGIKQEVAEQIYASEISLADYNCQNILDERNEIDLKSAIVLTDILKKWRNNI